MMTAYPLSKIQTKLKGYFWKLNLALNLRKTAVGLLAVGQRRVRTSYIRSLPPLNPTQKNHVQSLLSGGFAGPFNSPHKSLIDEISTTISDRIRHPIEAAYRPGSSSKKKPFFTHLQLESDCSQDSPFLQYALNPEIISIVSHYFGTVPRLLYFQVIHSTSSLDNQWKVSQRWHRDYDDNQMVKFFTYLSDVRTQEDGPFTFIPANKINKNIVPDFPIHKSDQSIESFGLKKHVMEVYGKPATSFLIDTHRCLHMGSRLAPNHSRLALIISYATYSTHKFYNNIFKDVHPRTEIEKLVLDL